MPNRIVLMRPHVPEAAIDAVKEVLRSRWIGQGPKVEEFEQVFQARQRCTWRPAVAVGSCTDALHLAYILAGIGPGDEVLAPLFTCTATNIPLLYLGAKIRFVDVAPGSLNIDPKQMAHMVDERTKAMVVVHYGGMRVKIAGMLTFNPGRYIPLIEDCAQALGAPGAGEFGDFSCFSFQAVKHVTTGDGGMLTFNDKTLLDKAKRIRWFGIDRQAKLEGVWQNDISEIGYKYQMTDIAAAMGLAGLEVLDEQIVRRRQLRDHYVSGLTGMDGITVVDQDPESACWLMTVLVERRKDFRKRLAAAEIESDQVHYRNDRYSIFKEFRGEFPNMDAIDGKYLCLPLHMGMDLMDVERILSVIRGGW